MMYFTKIMDRDKINSSNKFEYFASFDYLCIIYLGGYFEEDDPNIQWLNIYLEGQENIAYLFILNDKDSESVPKILRSLHCENVPSLNLVNTRETSAEAGELLKTTRINLEFNDSYTENVEELKEKLNLVTEIRTSKKISLGKVYTGTDTTVGFLSKVAGLIKVITNLV